MKSLILFVIVCFTTEFSSAQTILTGTITDISGRPLPLANVLLEGSYDGASTDADGKFEFITSETGSKIFLVTYTGYDTYRQEIKLNGKALTFNVRLEEGVHSLDAVTITAGSFTAGDQSAKTIFRAVDIATTAGATADIAGALNTLPGTQKVGESGRLFVRGGDGNETRTFIDGLLVGDPYSPAAPNAPSRGRFLPFMFKGISFSTGGYSAEYGQALSSALVLDSKDEGETTRTDFGILSVGGDVGHTHVWQRGSVGAKVQYTNLRPYFRLIEQDIKWTTPPESKEVHAALRQQSGKHGLLKVYGNFNHAGFSLSKYNIDDGNMEPYDLTNRYKYLNTSYKNVLGEKWMLRGGLSYTDMGTRTALDSVYTTLKEKVAHSKLVVEGTLSKNVELKTGGEFIWSSYSRSTTEPSSAGFNETLYAVFAEADIYITNRFISRSGLRTEYSALLNAVTIDPRISLAYKTGSQSQLSFAFGQFRQSAANRFPNSARAIEPERAAHYLLNYQLTENNRTFRAELYLKKYKKLIKSTNGAEQYLDNSGHGFARGYEIFWRDNESVKNTDYWVSYSFLDTRRTYLDFPVEAVPVFASKHNLSMVFKHFISPLRSQLGITCSFTSGRPYHNPNSGGFNSEKTPAYQDISLNWSYLPTPSVIIYVSCTNLPGYENIFGYEYGQKRNEQGVYPSRPIRPAARSFLFAGIFITLSKDRTISQLPNL